MNEKIFIVDDEKALIQSTKIVLAAEDYKVDSATSGQEGVTRVTASMPDLVLLDLRLPDIDGFKVCKALKANPNTKSIPIIMLSSRSDEVDVVLGLELGADDYIIKPFRKRELLARIRTVFRRREIQERPVVIECGPVQVNLASYTATIHGKPVDLRPKELELLGFFVKHESQVMTRTTISNEIWGMDLSSSSRTIDVHIKQLRKKVAPFGAKITAIKGIGYRFEVE